MKPRIMGVDALQPTTIDGMSSSDDVTVGSDVLLTEKDACKSDIENERPIDKSKCERAKSSESPKQQNNDESQDDNSLMISSPRREKLPSSPRSKKKSVLKDDELKSPSRKKKPSEPLLRERLSNDNAQNSINHTYVDDVEMKSPKRRERHEGELKSPRRTDAISPKPKSRTPKSISNTPSTNKAQLPMLLTLDDDDAIGVKEPRFPSLEQFEDILGKGVVNASPCAKNLAESKRNMVAVTNDADAQLDPRKCKHLPFSSTASAPSDEENTIEAPEFILLDRYRTPDRRARSDSVRQRRSNSLPPKESRATVLSPAQVQTPLRRSQKKKIDAALIISCSPEKSARRSRKKTSEINDTYSHLLEGGAIKSPKRDRKAKEHSGDPPSSNSPRRTSDDTSSSPKKTPVQRRRRIDEEKPQNEKWSLMAPMDENDFDEIPSKTACSSEKLEEVSLTSSKEYEKPKRIGEDKADEFIKNSLAVSGGVLDPTIAPVVNLINSECLSEVAKELNVSVVEESQLIVNREQLLIPHQPHDSSSLASEKKENTAESRVERVGNELDPLPLYRENEELVVQKNIIEPTTGCDQSSDEELDILDDPVEARHQVSILQMSAVAASMDEAMTKVWARFDDQMHRSKHVETDSDGDDGTENNRNVPRDAPSIELKESETTDQTIMLPDDPPSLNSKESESVDRTRIAPGDPPSENNEIDQMDNGQNEPSEPPSSKRTTTLSVPLLHSPDDSRLSVLQKLLVVDLWNEDAELVKVALNGFPRFDIKSATELMQQGGHLALIVLLRKWASCASIQSLIFGIVQKAAECLTEFADALVALGALDLILCSIKTFIDDDNVASAGCGALLNLTLPAVHAKVFVFELNGIKTIASACARFPSNVSLQKYTLWMIQYFSYWDDFKAPIVQAGGMQALAKMIEAFSHRSDDTAGMETILKSASATMKRLL